MEVTQEQAIEIFKSVGLVVKFFNDGEYFDVNNDKECVNYYNSPSKLTKIKFIGDTIAAHEYKRGFEAGEKSKADEIKHSLGY